MKENDLERFNEEIGMQADPNQLAKEALKAHQDAAGVTFDDPDAPIGPDQKYLAQMSERELGSYMGDGRK
jgi:hypothetical protein